MIDAQAVSSQLATLLASSRDPQGTKASMTLERLQEELRQLPFEHHADAAGNQWVTLAGQSAKAVLLGNYLDPNKGTDPLGSRLGLVIGLETLKALTHRFEGGPPCTVQLVVWAEPESTEPGASVSAFSPPAGNEVAAYLELGIDLGTQPANTVASLGVVTSTPLDEQVAFNPRLVALCDEAIRELTGASTSFAFAPTPKAVEALRIGIPTAIMRAHPGSEMSEGALSQATRLHLLQAAEAFGRWAEATVHLVAGEAVDLWALEHRVPHS